MTLLTNKNNNSDISVLQLAKRATVMKCIENSMYTLTSPSCEIRDRSSPVIECVSLKKYYNRSKLAKSIRESSTSSLRHVSLVSDRSSPIIEPGLVINFSERRAFLSLLKIEAVKFLLRLRSSASTGVDNAKVLVETTPEKVVTFYDSSKEMASEAINSAIQKGKIQASIIQQNTQGMLDSGLVVANHAIDTVKESALIASTKTSGILDSGLVAANQAIETVKESALIASSKTSAFASVVADKTRSMMIYTSSPATN